MESGRETQWAAVLELGLNIKEAGGVLKRTHKRLEVAGSEPSPILHGIAREELMLRSLLAVILGGTGLLKRARTGRCIKRRDQQLCFSTEPKSGAGTRHHAGRHKRRTYSRHRCRAGCAQSRASAKPAPHASSERHAIIAGSRSRVRCSGIRYRRRHVRKCDPRSLEKAEPRAGLHHRN